MIGIAAIEHDDLQELGLLYEELTGKPSDSKQMSIIYQAMQANSGYHIVGAKSGQTLVGSAMGIVCFDLVGANSTNPLAINWITSKALERDCRIEK